MDSFCRPVLLLQLLQRSLLFLQGFFQTSDFLLKHRQPCAALVRKSDFHLQAGKVRPGSCHRICFHAAGFGECLVDCGLGTLQGCGELPIGLLLFLRIRRFFLRDTIGERKDRILGIPESFLRNLRQ